MNGLPEYKPQDDALPPEDSRAETGSRTYDPEPLDWTPEENASAEPVREWDNRYPEAPLQDQPKSGEQPLFQQWYQPPKVRIPHLGHLLILGFFLLFGLLGATVFVQTALHFHLFGVRSLQKAITDIHYTLGSEAVVYLLTFVMCLIFFPMIWHRSFFAGIQWNGMTALRLRRQLFLTAAVCFVLALVNGFLLPGPKNAPIDKIFKSPGAAWLLFGFGVTFAPFFEEMIFRGFLLPVSCTAFDWMAEKFTGKAEREAASRNRPRWSPRVIMKVSLVFLSAPVALALAFLRFHGRSSWLFVLAYVLGLSLLLVLLEIYAPKLPRVKLSFVDHDHPVWSFPSLIVGSLATSIPFAAMHAAQTGYSLGPFILLVGVSMVLCWARLSTRSLAASVLVHASYNFLLFSLMMLGTSGFRHMDKM